MMGSSFRCISTLSMLVLAVACGDDEPTGTGGGGGTGGGTTASAGTTSSTASSGDGGGGSDLGSTGGAPGSGGAGGDAGGGGAAALPHPVEIALDVWPEGANVDAIAILVNDEDGTLVHRFDGGELPVTVDVVDGQLISYVDSGPTLLSHRVTAELTRVHRAMNGSSEGPPCEMGGVMPIDIAIPEVPGAALYEVQSSYEAPVQTTTPGTITLEVATCASIQTLDIVVTASTGEGEVLALEAIPDVPYMPDQPVAFDLTMPPPERDLIAVAISSVEGMERVHGYSRWLGPGPGFLAVEEPALTFDVIPSSGTLDYAPAVVSPGFGLPIVQVHARRPPEEGGCVTSVLTRVGATDETLAFDARGLRTPTRVGETGWAWQGEGEHGVIVYRRFEHRHGQRWWSLFEDPRSSAGPAVFPELPPDLAPLAPVDGVVLHTIGHFALEGTDGYAAYLADPDAGAPIETSRATAWQPCDD